MVPVYVLSSTKEVEDALKVIKKSKIISLDLEGVFLSRTGMVSLLQIFNGKAVFIFDVIAMKTSSNVHLLKDLLQSPDITKIMFDCRKDIEALYFQFNIILEGVIDTQMCEIVHRYKLNGREPEKEGMTSPRCFLGLLSAAQQYNVVVDHEYYSELRRVALDTYCPERGGRMEIWGERPLDMQLLLYCAEDIKIIYKLYTKVFSKVLSYETCIGVTVLRIQESMKADTNGATAATTATTTTASTNGNNGKEMHPVGNYMEKKTHVNFDVEVYAKFEDCMRQYKKLGLLKGVA